MNTIFLKKVSSPFIYVLLLITLFTGFQIVTASFDSKAHALTQCSGIGPCLGTVATTVVSGTTGSDVFGNPPAPVKVGAGNVVSNPAPQMVCDDAGVWGCAEKTQYKVDFFPTAVAYGYGCGDTSIMGFTVKPSGVVVTQQNDFWYWRMVAGKPIGPMYTGWRIISHTCVYPPAPTITGTNMMCILDYTAHFERMANSRMGYKYDVFAPSSKTVSSIGQLESTGKSACQQSLTASTVADPQPGQASWGQYQATSRIGQARCNFATFNFDGASTNVGKCSPAGDVPGSVGRITLSCHGGENGWKNYDWTGSDCQTTGQLVCTIPDSAKYEGFAGNVQALRNGKYGVVQWGTPLVKGATSITAWRSSTVVNAGSTPRLPSVSDNSSTSQLFKSDLTFGTGMTSGQKLTQNIAFYTAGDSGAPFSMTRNYRYDAWFNATQANIRTYDLKSGTIGFASYIVNVFAVDNKCGPQQSPQIDVIRAIGDNIN